MKGKVVVITGASEGIGAALSQTLAKRGAKPVLVARRKAELDMAASACDGFPIAADVTQRGDVQRVLNETLQKYGKLDVWVNNVGRGISRPVTELTDEDLDEMMRINVKTALYGMQVATAHFRAQGRGHLINVSSLLGRVPLLPARSAYSAAKHFLNSLTADLREELKDTQIQISLVSPGLTSTRFGLNSLHGGVDSRSLPGGQSAQEVADVIAEVIENPKDDVYTRPEFKKRVIAYFSEL